LKAKTMSEAKPPKRERTKEETALQIQRIVNRLLKKAALLKPYLDSPDGIRDFGNSSWNYFDQAPCFNWAVLRFVNEEESTSVDAEKHNSEHFSLMERAKGVDLTDHQSRIDAVAGKNASLTSVMHFEGGIIDENGLETPEVRCMAARILYFCVERLNEIEAAAYPENLNEEQW
jgi:hypothetical protein